MYTEASNNELRQVTRPEGYPDIMQQMIVQLRFRRGTKVVWCPDPAAAHLEYGIVDCESAVKPGFYFVRSEDSRLHCINWTMMMSSTAARAE